MVTVTLVSLDSRSFLQAAFTAEPTLAVVCEPDAIGASGSCVSPSSKRTFSTGTPSSSAAICVMIVYAPVPRSCVPACTRKVPSSFRSARAEAPRMCAGYDAVAMPQPMSHDPSRIVRGINERFDQPKRSAPCL